jgi:hypothetical protein
MSKAMDLQELSDRQEIADLLHRYARGVDTRDWDLWRTVFTADAYIDYRSAGGIEGNRDTVGEWLASVLADFPVTQHYITNIEASIVEDSATVRALFYNPMIFPGGSQLSHCGGWYDHQLVRTSDGWRSRRLVEHNAWFENPPPGLNLPGA